MASRYFTSTADETATGSANVAMRETRDAYQTRDDEALARRLDSIGRNASWLKPDAAMSLAQSGVDANHPDFDKLAKAAGKQKVKKSGFGWHSNRNPSEGPASLLVARRRQLRPLFRRSRRELPCRQRTYLAT